MEDPTLRTALITSLATLLVTGTPVLIMLFRSKAKSSEARSLEDSARAEKEKLEAENQRFVLELARGNMQTAQTLVSMQNKLLTYEARERELSDKFDRLIKRISWLEKKVIELGGTIDDDDSYPIKDIVPVTK